MAVVNTKSTNITNADTSPPVLNDVTVYGGRIRSQCGTVEVAAGDDDTSVFRFARVPSNARIISIKRYNDAIANATVYDVGLYKTAADGGAVVLVNAYANDVDISAGTVAGVEQAFTTRNIDKIANKVWQDAGLSADSKIEYDICLTGATVGTAAGTISLEVQYVID
jgi:hypothetical protein